MDISISPRIAIGCLILLQPLAADTIALTSGEKIEGTVLREDGDDYIVEVVVSGTIKDERRIARSNVKFIEKEAADEKAFRKIKIPLPVPDLQKKEAYEEWMASLESFLKAHPDSRKARRAKELLDILSSEYASIVEGGIKVGGKLISAEDYEANAYEYDAKISEKTIKDAVSRKNFLGALRIFTQYSERFGQSEGIQEITTLMLQVLGTYNGVLTDNIASLERRLENRESGLASMTLEDRVNTERALKEQMEGIQGRYEREKASGVKWITPHTFHKVSLEEAVRAVNSEISRLQKLAEPKPLEKPLAEVYREAWGKLGDIAQKEIAPANANVVDESESTEATEATEATEEEKKLAAAAEEERIKVKEEQERLILEGKKKIVEEAKASQLPEFYLQKLRKRAGLDKN